MIPEGKDQAAEPPGKAAPEQAPKPKRPFKRRLRRWVLFFGILGLLTFLVNGPVARWGIEKYLSKTLEKIGLTGDFNIEGSIAGGFVLTDVKLDGDKSIIKLYLSRAEVSYDLNRLIEEQTVEILDVDDLDLAIDIDYRGPKKEDKGPSPSAWEILSLIQPYIESNPIHVTDAKVALLRGDEPFMSFDLGKLEHKAGSQDIFLRDFIGRTGSIETEKQTVTITWEPEAMRLDRWEVVPNLTAADVVLDWQGDQLQTIDATVSLADSPFDVSYLPNGILRASKNPGPSVDSKTVADIFGTELPLGVTVDSLSVELSDMSKPFPEWGLDASGDFSQFTWEDIKVPSISLNAQQHDGTMEVKSTAEKTNASVSVDLIAEWSEPTSEEWWLHADAEGSATLKNAGAWLDEIQSSIDMEPLEISSGNLELSGHAKWTPGGLTALKAGATISELLWRGKSVPALELQAQQKSANLWMINAIDTEKTLAIDTDLNLTKKTYQGSLKAEEASLAWINPLLQLFAPELTLNNAPSLQWTGSGSWETADSVHEGSLELEPLRATYGELPELSAQLNADYSWPNFIKANSINASYGDLTAVGSIDWEDKRLSVPSFTLSDLEGELLQIQGAAPLDLEVKSAEDFLDQTGPVSLKIASPSLTIKRLVALGGLQENQVLNEARGNLETELLLDGTFQDPVLRGSLTISELRGLVEEGLSPISGKFDFDTLDAQLIVNGNLKEGDNNVIAVESSLPFKPSDLVSEPDSYRELPLDLKATVNDLKFKRITSLIPDLDESIRKITGQVDLVFQLGGTFEEPDWKASTELEVADFRLIKKAIPRVEGLKVKAKFANEKLTLESLSGRVGGGLVTASGTADVPGLKGFDINPELGAIDLKLTADHAPVYRDDQVLVRANADLNLKGTVEDATLSGKIDIVESLFFKDIELIPIGVPRSDVASFELPKIDAAATANRLPIPGPFGAWKLDLNVALKDPFLVRGNLAKGRVTGSLKVGGTLANPAPQGNLNLDEIVAKLPFSKLQVNNSQVRFTPKSGLDPQLDIRGRSRVGNYDVSVFAYGSVANPKVVFSSNPPLPEADIMTLLATGTTTAGLEDTNVASAKAFQLLLAEVRQRSNRPGGNELFSELLSVLDNIDINFGASESFTNRRFNSASIKFTERWNFTAMIDQEGNTRGLVVFSIRLK